MSTLFIFIHIMLNTIIKHKIYNLYIITFNFIYMCVCVCVIYIYPHPFIKKRIEFHYIRKKMSSLTPEILIHSQCAVKPGLIGIMDAIIVIHDLMRIKFR